jgi:molybdate/tungstate transport system substrate-binding protein
MKFADSSGKKIVIAVILILVASTLTLVYLLPSSQKTTLKVFHAGSLSEVFLEIEREFEAVHTNIDVQRESAGSVDTIRKVTDLGKSADVVATSDYRLIETMMMASSPRFADFYIQFARNEMVIAYTEYSTYHEEINATNWYDILRRTDVNIGFSNPNSDPCGYRALMLIQLAELHYGDGTIFEDLVVEHTSISVEESGNDYTINAPNDINPDSSIMIRPKEVDLMGLLEAGELDYLFIYNSVVHQHRSSGVQHIDLPDEIDLSSHLQNETYGRIKLVHNADSPENARVITGSPIIYGITIPTSTAHLDIAVEFLKFVLDDRGQGTLGELGQQPIVPSKTNDVDKVPVELKPFVANVEEDQ